MKSHRLLRLSKSHRSRPVLTTTLVAVVLFWSLLEAVVVAAAAAAAAATTSLRGGSGATASSSRIAQQKAHHRSLQATRGIPGTTQTEHGYDTELGTDAICWYSTGTSSSSSALTDSDTEQKDDNNDMTTIIALPNPLVADYTLDERVHLLSSCPPGNSLQAHSPTFHSVDGQRLRTLQWYNYTISISLNITSLLQEQQFIAETAAKTSAAAVAATGLLSTGSTTTATTGGEETTLFVTSEAHQEAQEAQTLTDLVEAATAIGFISDPQEEGEGETTSTTSFVAFQVVNCVVGITGFCSPFIHEEANHRLYVDAMARGEDKAPAPPARGNLHGETHVHSPYIKIPLPVQDGPVYVLNVTVPMLINHENSFFSIAAVQLYLPDPTIATSKTTNTSSNITRLVRYDMANALFGKERLLSYQEPATILIVPTGIAICSYICIAGTVIVISFLLQQTIQHRNHQILQLSQASFLIVFQVAALIASCACIMLQPNNDTMCAWGRPILLSSLQFMYAITVGRLWRIHTVISPLLLQTLRKRQTSRRKLHSGGTASNSNRDLIPLPPALSRFSWICSYCSCCCWCCTSDGTTTTEGANNQLMSCLERISRATSSVLSCCGGGGGDRRAKSLRRQVTSSQLAVVVSIFTIPQVVVQILAATLQPLQYQIDFNNDESIGRAVCSNDVDIASSLSMYGYYIFLLLIIMLLFMAQATRQLPSLFNETKYILDSTVLSLVLLAVGVSIILVTNSPTTSPGVEYLVSVSIVLSMTLNATLRIVWPKLGMIWRGETVLVSKLVSDHAAHARSRQGSGSGSGMDANLHGTMGSQDGNAYMNKTRISGLYPPPVTTSSTAGCNTNSQLTNRGGGVAGGVGDGGAMANINGRSGDGASNTHFRFHSSFGQSDAIQDELDRFHNESIASKRSLVGSECDSCPAGAAAAAAATATTLANDDEQTAKRLQEILVFENDDSESKNLIMEGKKLDSSHPEQEAAVSTESASSIGPNPALPRPSVSFADGTKATELNEEASHSPLQPGSHHQQHHCPRVNHHCTVVRQNETPARRLVLKMMDLEDCLSSVNERIMSGMAVPPEDWETLRRVAGKMGDVFMNDVQFEWEQDEDNNNNTASSHDGGDIPRNMPSTKAAEAAKAEATRAEDIDKNEDEEDESVLISV